MSLFSDTQVKPLSQAAINFKKYDKFLDGDAIVIVENGMHYGCNAVIIKSIGEGSHLYTVSISERDGGKHESRMYADEVITKEDADVLFYDAAIEYQAKLEAIRQQTVALDVKYNSLVNGLNDDNLPIVIKSQLASEFVVEVVDLAMGENPSEVSGYIGDQDFFGDMKDMFSRFGITILGSGYFSMAVKMTHFEGYAIKVGFKREDSGAAYAAWCRANPSEFVSNILFTQRYANVYTVVMPCYESYRKMVSASNTKLSKRQKIEARTMYEIAESIIRNHSTGASDTKLIREFIIDGCKSTHDSGFDTFKMGIEMGEDLVTLAKLERFRKVCVNIKKYFDGIAEFDLHDENIMIHIVDGGEVNMVITDPVSFTKES